MADVGDYKCRVPSLLRMNTMFMPSSRSTPARLKLKVPGNKNGKQHCVTVDCKRELQVLMIHFNNDKVR